MVIICCDLFVRDLPEIIEPKNMAAGIACHHIFGFYMDHFFLGVPLLADESLSTGIAGQSPRGTVPDFC
jgi:hypothetical protein